MEIYPSHYLKKIGNYLGDITCGNSVVSVNVDPLRLTLKKARLLYPLFNNFGNFCFIVIHNVPACIMPDAEQYLFYEKKPGKRYFKDDTCEKCCFRNRCPGWNGQFKRIHRKDIKPAKNIPKEIAIETTADCNLNCVMCGKPIKRTALSGRKVKKVIDEAGSLGVNAVRFTGGEPLMSSEIDQWVNYAKKKGMYVTLNTNLSLLGDTHLNLLSSVDNILVSLQGYNKISDKKITAADYDFTRKIKNICLLKKIIPVVRIGTIVSRTLIEDFDRYRRLVQKLDVSLWELYRPMVKPHSVKQLDISREDMIKLITRIHRLKSKNPGFRIKIANPVPFCICDDTEKNATILTGGFADDGHSRIVFDARGFFKPSYYINENLGSNLKNAWESAWRDAIKNRPHTAKCRYCFYQKWCREGSRYAAYLSSGDYRKPDPWV